MEIFRRRQVEKEIEESNKFSDGGRFHTAYEGKDETEILRTEPKRLQKRAEKRIKAIDLAIEDALAARMSKTVKSEPQTSVRKAKGGRDV